MKLIFLCHIHKGSVQVLFQSMASSNRQEKPPDWVVSQRRAWPPYITAWPVDQGHAENYTQLYDFII